MTRRAVVGDGSACGVSVRYHEEERALGTAGPLASIPDLHGTFLLVNGDVLTTLDFQALIGAHQAAGNDLTIATHRRTVRADYGVLHTDGALGATHRVLGYREKPELGYTVSMDVYALEPAAISRREDDFRRAQIDAGRVLAPASPTEPARRGSA